MTDENHLCLECGHVCHCEEDQSGEGCPTCVNDVCTDCKCAKKNEEPQ